MSDLHPPLMAPGAPKYALVMDALRRRISAGVYRLGEAIPRESSLQAEFGVSRITVRRAIDELAREGLLRKEQGKGTFVRAQEITQLLNALTGVTETMVAMGLAPADRELELRMEPAAESIAQLLGLEPGAEVWHLSRLRVSGDAPICLIDNYIRPEHVPGFSTGILLQSLYWTYERRYGLSLARGEEIVQAQAATGLDAARLQLQSGKPILVVTRTTFLQNGQPLEVAIVRSRPDRYRYGVTLTGRPSQRR